MLLPVKVADAIREGTASLAFRRWAKPEVRVGSTFLTAAGLIRVEEVAEVDAATITDEDAALAGWPSADRLRAKFPDEPPASAPPSPDASAAPTAAAPRTTYRIRLSWAGEDPRHELRQRPLADEDVAALDTKLERLDRASSHGPWTIATLELIARKPRVRAPDLAAEQGRERDPFKIDVRKLKNLGLTISHEVGYELSPRGVEYLARTTRRR
jgi:hypothetical protein